MYQLFSFLSKKLRNVSRQVILVTLRQNFEEKKTHYEAQPYVNRVYQFLMTKDKYINSVGNTSNKGGHGVRSKGDYFLLHLVFFSLGVVDFSYFFFQLCLLEGFVCVPPSIV